MRIRRHIAFLIYLPVFLLVACLGEEFPNINNQFSNQNQSKSNEYKYRLDFISGDEQAYVGFSPEPIQFKIFNLTLESYDNAIYFSGSGLWITLRSRQGEYEHFEDPVVNPNLRIVKESCECYEVNWRIRDPEELTMPHRTDTIKIILSVFNEVSKKHINGSPMTILHFVQGK